MLGAINQAYKRMEKVCQAMLHRKLNDDEARAYLCDVIPCPVPLKDRKALPRWVGTDREGCFQQFKKGKGNNLPGIGGTMWAAYNGVTDYYDHFRSYGLRGDGNRMAGALFGRGLAMKNRAYHKARKWLKSDGPRL